MYHTGCVASNYRCPYERATRICCTCRKYSGLHACVGAIHDCPYEWATRKCAFGGNSRSPKGAAEEVALHLRRSKQQASFTTAPACTARCICNAFVITCMSCEASSRNRLKILYHCKLHLHCSMYTASFVYHPSMKTHTNYSRTWSGPLQYYTHIVVWCYNQHLKC